jgi:hypothetical protein
LASQANIAGLPSLSFATLPGVEPDVATVDEQLVQLGWASAIAYAGIAGMPSLNDAGSVLRPSTTVRLSIRIPPTLDASAAASKLGLELTSDPPQGVRVTFDVQAAQNGWHTSPNPRMIPSLNNASTMGYENAATFCAGGATVPPLEMLSLKFPSATVLPVGVVTAANNPHGPDESLNLRAAVQLSEALTWFLIDMSEHE